MTPTSPSAAVGGVVTPTIGAVGPRVRTIRSTTSRAKDVSGELVARVVSAHPEGVAWHPPEALPVALLRDRLPSATRSIWIPSKSSYNGKPLDWHWRLMRDGHELGHVLRVFKGAYVASVGHQLPKWARTMHAAALLVEQIVGGQDA